MRYFCAIRYWLIYNRSVVDRPACAPGREDRHWFEMTCKCEMLFSCSRFFPALGEGSLSQNPSCYAVAISGGDKTTVASKGTLTPLTDKSSHHPLAFQRQRRLTYMVLNAAQLPYEVLLECFQAARNHEMVHGGELVRWASNEAVAPFALVCKAWTNREYLECVQLRARKGGGGRRLSRAISTWPRRAS